MHNRPDTPYYAYPPALIPHYGWVPPYMIRVPASEWEYGSFFRRFFGSLIDSFIFLVPVILLGVTAYGAGAMTQSNFEKFDGSWAEFGLNVLFNVLGFVYHVGFTMRGGTPGFRAVGLRVTSADGTNPGMRSSILRQIYVLANWALSFGFAALFVLSPSLENAILLSLGAIVLMAGLSLMQFFGCLMIIWDDHKQGLHDHIAGTYVIHRRT